MPLGVGNLRRLSWTVRWGPLEPQPDHGYKTSPSPWCLGAGRRVRARQHESLRRVGARENLAACFRRKGHVGWALGASEGQAVKLRPARPLPLAQLVLGCGFLLVPTVWDGLGTNRVKRGQH